MYSTMKRKNSHFHPMSIVITPPANFNPSSDFFFLSSSEEGAVELPYKLCRVRQLKTAEEIKATRRAYRKEYARRPYVQEKIKARLNNPEVIARRKAYSERPDVKARKQILASRARAVKNRLKEQNPLLYNQIVNSIDLSARESSLEQGYDR